LATSAHVWASLRIDALQCRERLIASDEDLDVACPMCGAELELDPEQALDPALEDAYP